ncbi:VWA domain-containing protein [Glycomyces rhizosphaerae]|uniref:VWA domain-containing protein n=1 Tax=Glycomyces rhizosphaerae TaxID=2054422 RepID=A0ABV7PZT8_9ACTN
MVFGTTHKVKTHRLGRRRKKGGNRMVVAPWIVITLVCVLVAAGLTWGFVALMRAGCSGAVYRVSIAVAPSVFGTLEDAALEWEATEPEASNGQCIGAEIREVTAADASRGISGGWDEKVLGPLPIAWVPDSQAWVSWKAADDATAGYVAADPLVLGKAASVLAVPASKAAELGWDATPPAWTDVLTAAQNGTVALAAADPRASTEGLVSMLNATGDGAGGFSEDAMAAWNGAIAAGTVLPDADEQLEAYNTDPDPTQVITALDYQVEDFNTVNEPADPLVPITPAGPSVDAVATYLVLGGGWVSDSDAAIAEAFGDHLKTAVDSGAFEDSELQAVEDPAAALAQTTPDTVGATVKSWNVGREALHVLFLIDRSATSDSETVEYGGESLTAGDAAVRAAVDTVEGMDPTYQAGMWEYGVGADGDQPYREVTDMAELSDDNRDGLIQDLLAASENSYEGSAPLYDTLVAAYTYMNEQSADGALNVIVVLTNSSQDQSSSGTAEETATALTGLGGSTTVYTVGFGETDPANLTTLATATGGAYIAAPADGGVLEAIGGS